MKYKHIKISKYETRNCRKFLKFNTFAIKKEKYNIIATTRHHLSNKCCVKTSELFSNWWKGVFILK